MEPTSEQRRSHRQSSRAGQGDWRAVQRFMVRSPTLPIETFYTLADAAGRSALGQAVSALLDDPRVALALAIASPSLAEALANKPVVTADGMDSTGRGPHLLRSLLAYATRMSSRPTPFGLFAGVALGEWAARTHVDLSGTSMLPRARPDMAWLFELLGGLEADQQLRARLRLTTHPAVRVLAGRAVLPGAVRVGESAFPGGAGGAGGANVSVRATPVIRQALEACRDGAVAYADLVGLLIATPGRGDAEVKRVVDVLCEQGFLITQLRPQLTDSPAEQLLTALRASAGAPGTCQALDQLLRQISAWERLPGRQAMLEWPVLVEQAGRIGAREPALQVDSAFSDPVVRLPRSVAVEASRAVDLLCRLAPWPTRYPGLDTWRREFNESYGIDREVPLLDIVGHGLPELMRGSTHNAARDRLLLRLAGSALRDGRSVVELDEAWIGQAESTRPGASRPPATADLYCAVAAESQAALDAGDFLLVVTGNAAAAPAGRSFGRFGHVFGERALSFLDELPDGEPDTLDAELLYEPTRPRLGNVMIRPRPRRPVIVVNGAVPADLDLIPLNELAVVSTQGRLRLIWTRLGVPVAASCQHMLNVNAAPALARFLHVVSHDGERPLGGFFWGAAEHLPFRPRVQIGKVVLRPAEWSMDRQFLDDYVRDRAGACRSGGLPRYVRLGASDNQLLLDLNSDISAELLLHAGSNLTGQARLRLQEALPGPQHAFAQGADGHRMLELVVPMVHTARNPAHTSTKPSAMRSPSEHATARRAQRSPLVAVAYPPGSGWLYSKLYLSPDAADEVIGGPIRELAETLQANGAISAWFFVRYRDPAFHLRLRFGGEPQRLRAEAFTRICDRFGELMNEAVVDRFGFDTYQPEVERYGGAPAVALIERLFAADSSAVADLLAARRQVGAALDWTHLAVRTVDDLVAGLGFDPPDRLRWYREHRRGHGHSAEYGRHKHALRALLAGRPGDHPVAHDSGLGIVEKVLNRRRPVIEEVASGLAALRAHGTLRGSYSEIARSIVHMHCNRLLAQAQAVEHQILALAALTAASLAAWPPHDETTTTNRQGHRA